jgi:hypothetical protein
MCIMALPVRSVSNTRIFVGFNPERTRQLTVYEMAVTLQTPGNAMILPVPATSAEDVELVDLSAAPKFFDDLDRVFEPMTLGMKGDRGLPAGGFLKVHDVGNYRVSVAGKIDDLLLVDPDVFSLSMDTAATLAKNYATGFAFVVATLRESGKFHPLAYTSPLTDVMFVPTRHEHGHEPGLTARGRHLLGANWDHHIYRQRLSVFTEMPGSKDHTEIRSKNSRDGYGNGMIRSWAASQIAKVPALTPFLDANEKTAKAFRTRFHGPLANMDLHLEI